MTTWSLVCLMSPGIHPSPNSCTGNSSYNNRQFNKNQLQESFAEPLALLGLFSLVTVIHEIHHKYFFGLFFHSMFDSLSQCLLMSWYILLPSLTSVPFAFEEAIKESTHHVWIPSSHPMGCVSRSSHLRTRSFPCSSRAFPTISRHDWW